MDQAIHTFSGEIEKDFTFCKNKEYSYVFAMQPSVLSQDYPAGFTDLPYLPALGIRVCDHWPAVTPEIWGIGRSRGGLDPTRKTLNVLLKSEPLQSDDYFLSHPVRQ